MFIGDEEFEGEVRQKAGSPLAEPSYPLKRIVEAVRRIGGVSEKEVKRSGRSEEVQRARELICYLSRRHGTASLAELRNFLGVKELSMASHALRRAKRRLEEDRGFGRQLRQVLEALNSSMQA